MKRRIFLLLLAFLNFSLFAKTVTNGVVNFEIASEDKKLIRLNGDWEFYKNQTFSSLGSSQIKIDFMQVPGSWTDRISNGYEKIPLYGCNTYRIIITGLHANSEYGIFSNSSPALSATIYANNVHIAEYGTFSRRAEKYRPAQVPLFCNMLSNEKGIIELVIQVSNFTQNKSGILSPIIFGQYNDIRNLYITSITIISSIAGALIFIFITTFLIWFFDKSYKPSLCFTSFVLFLLLRILFGNFNIMGLVFNLSNYTLQEKLQNLVLLSFGIFPLVYKRDTSFTSKYPNIDNTIFYIALGAGLFFICLPVQISSYIVSLLIVFSILFLIYSVFRFILSIKTGPYYIAFYACFYSIAFSGIILDHFFPHPTYTTFLNYTEICVVLLIFIVVAYLAVFLEMLMRNYTNQKNELSENYVTYRKFVPAELPHILNKENFGKIEVGDFTELNSAIMVIGEIVYSPDQTKISLREQFETIGFYSSKIAEIVEYFNGTVLSISGNSFIASFKENTKDAVKAAKEIQNILQVMNSRRAQDYYPCVAFNIALNYGPILLGIIGGSNRIDYTIVSSTVELVDNICTLGYYKQIPVLISENVVDNLEEKDKEDLKVVGKAKFSKISHPINLYSFASTQEKDSDNKPTKENLITQRDADKYINI